MYMLKTISSLEKCFIDENIADKTEYNYATVLKNDRLSYQICFCTDDTITLGKVVCHAEIVSELADYITVSNVKQVPSLMPAYPEWYDEYYLRRTPGMYPDLLIPLRDNPNIYIVSGQLHAIWVDIDIPKDFKHGEYKVNIMLKDVDGNLVGESVFTVMVLNAVLPEQKLKYTQWFYCDCLAEYYKVPVFSEEHWSIIEKFLHTAAKNGVNLILTPIFTPALDTAVGHERLTTQLLGIKKHGNDYIFDFTLLNRWIDLCLSVGIKGFEVSHFFTQWGAKHAPKIICEVNGEYKKIFGWETDSTSDEYRCFLRQLIPELKDFLKSKGVFENCVFHISDEPNKEQLESYLNAKNGIADLLKDCTVIDALSNYEFYSEGAVDVPVVATDHIQPFIDNKTENVWAYYCCGECYKVSNRFLSMPSARNRVIGVQLFRYNIQGFLHWGYNFYNNQYSIAPVDPYLTTDGEFFAPSGDCFSVYPAPNGGAYETIHLAVFTQALRDVRALESLAEKIGRDKVYKLIDEKAGMLITFAEYPHSDEFILSLRETVNMLLSA